MIDWEPDRAKWEQIADVIRARIASGEYGPKFLISEVTLVQEFGVARDTVRKTMTALRAEGLIYTVRGLGSFVSPPDGPPQAAESPATEE
ncbi:GntR family transcriptional regulator [Microbispora bryophytorum]|uniref:GntR family transcriptional regulator n=1 Tax=Microbispora bryophytorum TaxID=1460882 RepID=UPI0033D08178